MLVNHPSYFCAPSLSLPSPLAPDAQTLLSLFLGGLRTSALGRKPVVLHFVHGQGLMGLKSGGVGFCLGSCDHFG